MHNDPVDDPATDSAEHWNDAYAHGDLSRSWYQDQATASLNMLDRSSVTCQDSIIDVGGGASRLVDALLARGHGDVTVLDISETALQSARQRLGPAATQVNWLTVDLLAWRPERTYRIWHDRAVLHFLTDDDARQRYLRALRDVVETGGVAVIATFASDGPDHCSGLPVARYSPAELVAVLGSTWQPIADMREEHTTPGGTVQPFTWTAFRRL
jgi:trans-aconitate methyltransferase